MISGKLFAMLTKLKSLLTAKLNVWVVAIVVALLVGAVITYQHARQDHESLHAMVQMFNNCLAKQECKALFMAAQTPGK